MIFIYQHPSDFLVNLGELPLGISPYKLKNILCEVILNWTVNLEKLRILVWMKVTYEGAYIRSSVMLSAILDGSHYQKSRNGYHDSIERFALKLNTTKFGWSIVTWTCCQPSKAITRNKKNLQIGLKISWSRANNRKLQTSPYLREQWPSHVKRKESLCARCLEIYLLVSQICLACISLNLKMFPLGM